ncbi:MULTISPECIES: hypothetical protein [Acidithiobacillaceae]|jgi:hypothetical protein|uniref:Uncharacterized protein n=1 Tax=Igneacidithiobacillus copahuensis TaxID=2724909 RepID=A0AAE3CK11_9PROT|nr:MULTISPECIES: hypothetical protein [Acidithiobacillaceae]MBU2763342.1 hypothetical protein [Acidithiobacillus caldus]MBU2771181.1 hypothetical protein [Acidithiobacillus caldus]MBU2788392.1 hypothetical protein [Igneacidithiobacillus copahuensis]MBU2796370.1 hypothetical protein [Acidithiobacillus sp. VAN18-2]
MAIIVPGLAGIIRRPDGRSLAVLGCSDIAGRTMLHIQGTVDFWATPRELHRKGYRLMAAKPYVWSAWGVGALGTHRSPAAEVHAGL